MSAEKKRLRHIKTELSDTEWPMTGTDHDRQIARAVVIDGSGFYYFVRARRDDEFGRVTLIETSGGGVEAGEEPRNAVRRELREELGAEACVICSLGVVSDYYNLIRRHNINHYYLCRAKSFKDRMLTPDEIGKYHLSTLKLSYQEAIAEYRKRADTRLGRLIANRELSVLMLAKEIIDALREMNVRCLGDSNTYGYDPRACSDGIYSAPWPELLAGLTGCNVINDGINGRTIPRSLSGSIKSGRDNGILIVMLGTNDLLNGADADQAAKRMEAFLSRLDTREIILIAPPPMKRGAWVPDDKLVAESIELPKLYHDLAKRRGIMFADAGGWDIELEYDGVHFTEKGHARFAERLAPLLAESLFQDPAEDNNV